MTLLPISDSLPDVHFSDISFSSVPEELHDFNLLSEQTGELRIEDRTTITV